MLNDRWSQFPELSTLDPRRKAGRCGYEPATDAQMLESSNKILMCAQSQKIGVLKQSASLIGCSKIGLAERMTPGTHPTHPNRYVRGGCSSAVHR
jgi:hypothetical protein